MDSIDIVACIEELLPSLESLAGNITICKSFQKQSLVIHGNKILLESMINNLVVNAVRHNTANGKIAITIRENCFIVSNTSEEGALNPQLIFNRFYHPSEKTKGNGLGLAIVKAICDYHGWTVEYEYKDRKHFFKIQFHQEVQSR